MKSPTIILVGMPPDVLTIALKAAQLAFPHAQLSQADTLPAAMATTLPSSRQLLVLAQTDAGSIAAASQATDASGLPRWAVVALGPATSELVETVPPDEWSTPLLTRVFRASLLQHEMLCENLRLRGDLKTVARRINHDIRTPLGCVHTASDLIKSMGPEGISTVSEILGQSSVEIAQILSRMSLVLTASADPRIATPVKMDEAVANTLRQLAPEIAKTGAEIEKPLTWPQAIGVPAWVEVIWWNLLSNSLRHGGPSPRMRITWERQGDAYRFSVTDKGRGVPADFRSTLFSPFDQLHAVQSRGLGLTVVQRLVTLQGGTCGHENPAEGGSRFFFTLPASAAAPAVASA